MAKIRERVLEIVYGEIILVVTTVLVAYAFFDSTAEVMLRSVAVVGLLFLVLYIVWIKTHKSYEKIYKAGLKDTE